MSTLLIARLTDCCSRDLALEPLLAQWTFDKRLTSKALQNIGALFPHYSRHDESHSTQILINIERVLGPNRISQLSGTNVWLLLESAYFHDIGMVVAYKQKQSDWDSESFRDFVSAQKNQAPEADAELYDAVLNSTSRIFGGEKHPLQMVNWMGQLFAEYYRRSHAGRAAKIVLNPNESIGLDSPRNELIPNRLFRLLGAICEMHGKSHLDIMQMPHVATGLGNDLVHPRFIASMLRLGDLLDMDDNRFCPVMLEIAGELPVATHAHIDKHHAIRHLRIDASRIEAQAVCKTYDGYVETEKWFDYLRQEIAWQMAHWADIVPNEEFGLLPTIGEISTELEGYELAENRTRPHFQLDQPRIMELLQGAGLYDSPRAILRELVQNAIDATLLFVWLKHGAGEAADLPLDQTIQLDDSPYDSKVINILNNYPIYLSVSKDAQDVGSVVQATRIRISDSGAGISRDDLASMSIIGGSFHDTWKRSVYDRMPVWMRPSGAFGIGLQSVFVLTDEITYETKSVFNGETLRIRMSSPTGAEKGSIYIVRGQNAAVARKSGTTVEFQIKGDAQARFGIRRAPYEHFDPLINRDIDYFAGVLENTPVPAYLNDAKISQEALGFVWHYFSDVAVAVAIDLKDQMGRARLYFKGQAVRSRLMRLVFPCSVYVNIYGDAKKILTVNRSELRSKDIFQKIEVALVRAAQSLISKAESASDKAILSTLLLSLGFPSSDDFLDMRWQLTGSHGIRQYVYVENSSLVTFPSIRELLNSDLKLYQAFGDYSPRYVYHGGKPHSDSADSIAVFFDAIVHQGYKGYLDSVSPKGAFIGISKTRDAFDDSVFFDLLLCNLVPELRLAFPTVPRFKILGSLLWTAWVGELSRSIFCPGREYMYSPFIISNGQLTTNNLDGLVDWTFSNRIDQAVTRNEILLGYRDFIRFVDRGMSTREEWVKIKAYKLEE